MLTDYSSFDLDVATELKSTYNLSEMSSLYQPPLVPGLGSNTGPLASGNLAQTKNPFFSIGNQFLPRNLNDVIRWVRFITLHSPVTTEVMRKLATYPITKFVYDAKDPAIKAKYEEIVKSYRLKTTLHDVGFQYFTIGNVFLSIYYPFVRTYSCPVKGCESVYGAEQSNFLLFKDFKMIGTCPKCGSKNSFIMREHKSTKIKDMNLIIWDPMNISVNHNPISGKSKYYYQIPNEIKRKILMGDKLTIDSTPWEFVEAVQNKKDFEFADDYIFHLKNVDMGMAINGIAIPPLVSHFNLVFYQTTLRRANESIATDFMAPMRAIFPQPQTANSDPVVSMSMRNFVSKIEEAMVKHKRDNNHVLISPVPLGYQAISGEGKTLLVSQEITQAEESLLLSMGVSRELLSGTTNWTSSTVGLRMLKNTLESYVGQIEELLDWIFTKTSAYIGIENTKVKLTPFQLTDDEALKGILMALVNSGNVSMSTLYEALGRNWEDEMQRIQEDAKRKARHDVRTQFEVEQSQFLEGLEINKQTERDDSYMETLKACQDIANQLIGTDPNTLRVIMGALKVKDYAKFLLVSKLIEEAQTNLVQSAQMDQQINPQGAEGGGKSGPPGSSPAGAKPEGESQEPSGELSTPGAFGTPNPVSQSSEGQKNSPSSKPVKTDKK